MKRLFKSAILPALFSLATVSCLSDHPKESGEEPSPTPTPSPGPVAPDLSQFVGSLLDFDITWEEFDNQEIIETETVVTDATNEEYSDFVENFSFPNVVKISFDGTNATVENNITGVSAGISAGHVEINSTASGVEYILNGTATDGSLKLYSSTDVKITLNNVSLTSSKSAALNIQSNKNIYIVSADGSNNTLTDASTYAVADATEDQKGCIFGEGRIILSGNGSLAINANYNHAICSDKCVRTRAGSNTTINAAPSDAIHANDKVILGGGLLAATVVGDVVDCEAGDIEIRGGRLKAATNGQACKALKATGNIAITGGQSILITQGSAYFNTTDQDIKSAAGIRCTGSLNITDATVLISSAGTAGKGINCDGALTIANSTVKTKATGATYTYNSNNSSSSKAISAEGSIAINSGTVWALALGGDGCEGIESKMTLSINGGDVRVSASDNGLNATSSITINDGQVYGYSALNDALDSNGTVAINGGTVVLSGAAHPEGGIDCDQNTFKITGGTLLSIGGDTSMPTAEQCTQNAIVYKGAGTESQLFTITDTENKQIASYVIPRLYEQMAIVYSSASLASGSQYNIYTEGSYTGGETFCGLTSNGDYTPNSDALLFTVASPVTTVTPTAAQ